MPITAYVKNKRNNILPENRCLVALIFKDGGGLANNPLSCHPQGVFGRWENAIKGKKMNEKGSSGKTYCCYVFPLKFHQKNRSSVSTMFELIYSSK